MSGTWILLALSAGLSAAPIAADSSRGAQLFQTLECVQCHSISGKGGPGKDGKVGPDLGRGVDRGFGPATLAATMWNHAPAMWTAMRRGDVPPGNLDQQGAMDLFAYFYSEHFFDKPGDAGRGKAVFTADHCADCHGLSGRIASAPPEAKPVSEWTATGHPIELVEAMWNHAATMRPEFAKRKLKWPELSSQDLSDLLVYTRNLPAAHPVPERTGVEITAGASGEALFTSKGCAQCHTSNPEKTLVLKGTTLNDIAVAMWNHAPRMAAVQPELQAGEMRELVSYLWAAQFFEDSGNAAAGERVFNAKHCASCHAGASATAPSLAGRTFTGAAMVSALWHHGPRMLEQMKSKGVAWPRFDGNDMANLIAYLNKGQ